MALRCSGENFGMMIVPRHLNPSGITGKQAAAASRPVKEKCYLESYHNQNPLMFPKHSKASASGCWQQPAAVVMSRHI